MAIASDTSKLGLGNSDTAGPACDRIPLLDALRGFALFGILLANILYWSGWVLVTETERQAMATSLEQLWQYRFHHLLVDGKFYTLFSFLFGVGFAIQLDRLERRGANGLRIYQRRVLVLLAIGLLHSLLIWDGDILTLYALLGLLLPWFRPLRDRALLCLAALLIFLVPIAGAIIFEALGWQPWRAFYSLSDWVLSAFGWQPGPDLALRLLANGGIADVVIWNLSGTPYSWGMRIESWRIPKVLGTMLLGLWAGRRLAAGALLGDRRLLRQVLIGGLAIGFPASLAYALLSGQDQSDVPSMIGTVPLAMAYAAAFALAWPRQQWLLGLFAAPGRMALTNYLATSLVGALLFYGFGLGLIGRLSPLEIYGVAVAIFATQAVVSHWWLARHPQGPMEALWRRLTYGGVRGRGAAPAAR
jgi:uncharacterized protein